MSEKLKAIILIIALVIGGIFITNMPSSDKSLKRKNNELKTQISELSNYNNSLKEQNKIYESQIGDLTTENNTKDATISNLQEQNQAKDTTIAELQEQLENSSGSESSGYHIVILGGSYCDYDLQTPTYVKFDTPPTSADDYDFKCSAKYTNFIGEVTASKAYVWGARADFKEIVKYYDGTPIDFSDAFEIVFNSDGVLYLYVDWD